MKERLLDVLMYLFDHCLEGDSSLSTNQASLIEELEAAGFCEKDINKAFDWLEGIHNISDEASADDRHASFRVYTQQECQKINMQCRGLLWTLEQWEILNTLTREVIIDRAMALDMEEIQLDHFKWVTLMVLINRGSNQSIEWLEEIVFGEYSDLVQ